MSLILDALDARADHIPTAGSARHARADAHDDTVLATLGYRSARTRRAGLSGRMLVFYGVAAIAIGFVGLSLLIVLFAPPEPPTTGARCRIAPSGDGVRRPAVERHAAPRRR